MAVKKEDMAYTSASTAENQKLSEKVYTKAPTIPAPIKEMVWPLVSSPSTTEKSRLPIKVMDQNRKRIVKPAKSALPIFIQ